MTPDAFERLEAKIDKLTEAVSRLVLVEERQTNQGERIGALEQRVSACEVFSRASDQKIDKWVNRGIGVWAVAAAIFALFSKFWK